MRTQWLEHWFPKSEDAAADERQRASSLVRLTALILMGAMATYSICYAIIDRGPGPVSMFFVGAAFALGLQALLVRPLGPKFVGRALSLILVCTVITIGHTQDTLHAGILPWLAASPLIATVLAGPRFGLGTAVLAIGTHIAFFGLQQAGLPAPVHGAIPTYLTHNLAVLDTMLALVVVTLVGSLYEMSRRRTEAFALRTMNDLRRANRDLTEAKEIADAANHAKTQFVANISHELRTPMNGVIGMTDLLRNSELSEEQLEYTETARRSAHSLLEIINDILDFSKLDFEKLELNVQRFDLETVIEEALSLLTPEAYAKGLELSATMTRDVPTEVISDSVRLRQVLLNLINNAIKFTNKGEINLTCSLVRLGDTGEGLLRFEVTDTGIGIEPSLMSKLFDAFYQTDNSTTRQHGGTGLGLAISKRLVELMGGQIGIDSKLGKGSTFYFTHPVILPEDVLDLDNERSGTFNGLRGLCLMMGNRPRARRALSALLEREGVLADNATSLDEAFYALRHAQQQELPIRVCLVDVAGSVQEALAVAQQLRRAPLKISPAIVLLVAPEQRELRAQAKALGFATPITKPARRANLMAGIANAMSEAREPTKDPPQAAVPKTPKNKGRILLAEDIDTNQRTAVLMLGKLGYEVDVVENGAQALIQLQTRAYGAILMDCQMPVLDGYDATNQVRALDGDARHTIIIAMTAHASPTDRRKCLDAGMNDYLPKPVCYDDLRSMLDKWVHMGSRDPKAPTASAPISEEGVTVDLHMLETLRDLAGDDQHMVNELIRTYLDEAPRIIDDLGVQLSAAHATGAADAVHKLKSSSGNLGANRLSELCFKLESQARSDNLDEAHELMGLIQAEYSKVQQILQPLAEA